MSLSSPVLRVEAFGLARLPQESLRHILASPGKIAVGLNVTLIERGFNAGQTPRCIGLYPSIFKHF